MAAAAHPPVNKAGLLNVEVHKVAHLSQLLHDTLVTGLTDKQKESLLNCLELTDILTALHKLYEAKAKHQSNEHIYNLFSQFKELLVSIHYWIKRHRPPNRASYSVKQEIAVEFLYPCISSKVQPLIMELQNESIAETMMGMFVMTASLHLFILQELCINYGGDIFTYKHYLQIHMYSQLYIKNVEKVYPKMVTKRLEAVGEVQMSMFVKVMDFGEMMVDDQHLLFLKKFKDSQTGTVFYDHTEMVDHKWQNGGVVELDRRVSQIRQDYLTGLTHPVNDPWNAVSVWKRLEFEALPAGTRCVLYR